MGRECDEVGNFTRDFRLGNVFFFSSRRRHTRYWRDWSSDVCSSDLNRNSSPPPVGRDEFLLSVDSPATGGVTLTQVHGWKFHVDFGTPVNSTLGIGVNHSPNANITVAGFVDAFTTTTLLVPQTGTTAKLDTLGDKIMTPAAYQNHAGVESL